MKAWRSNDSTSSTEIPRILPFHGLGPVLVVGLTLALLLWKEVAKFTNLCTNRIPEVLIILGPFHFRPALESTQCLAGLAQRFQIGHVTDPYAQETIDRGV